MGMSEVLRSIKTAEQDAEKRLAEAQEEASKIVSDARRNRLKWSKTQPMRRWL